MASLAQPSVVDVVDDLVAPVLAAKVAAAEVAAQRRGSSDGPVEESVGVHWLGGLLDVGIDRGGDVDHPGLPMPYELQFDVTAACQ